METQGNIRKQGVSEQECEEELSKTTHEHTHTTGNKIDKDGGKRQRGGGGRERETSSRSKTGAWAEILRGLRSDFTVYENDKRTRM